MAYLGERTLDHFVVQANHDLLCLRCGELVSNVYRAHSLGYLVKIADAHICGAES